MADAKDKDDKTKDDDSGKLLKELAEGMAGLINRFDTVEDNVKGLNTRFQELTTPDPDKDKDGKQTKDGDVTQIPENLETLDRRSFLGVIQGIVADAVKELQTGVTTEVSGIKSDLSQKDLRVEIQSLLDNNKDYQDWLPEMKAIADESPGLSPGRIYALARTENPDKLKELNTKYGETDGNKDKPPVAPGFGGLTPTSGIETGDSKMNPTDAANKAFDEVFAGASVGESG